MEGLDETVAHERAMAWVSDRAASNGGWLKRDELLFGYYTETGQQLPLMNYSRGIWNPASFSASLSIVSSTDGPYLDIEGDDGLLHYKYEKGGPAGVNTKLRRAMTLGVPLILLVKTEKNVLVPVLPVYVVADDPASGTFTVALDEGFRYMADATSQSDEQKRYSVRLARQRLHQPVFRRRVLHAYSTRCSICGLAHARLLEAAHIRPDSHDESSAAVSNGLSLCSIHHSAYDANLLGISPDRKVHLRPELLSEVDGPMLRYGLQEMHGRRLEIPKRPVEQPDRDALAYRFELFAR